MGKVSVVLGGQLGSEGKGKIAGYLALKDGFDYSINNFYPNAGHTWVDDTSKVVVHQLPIALVNTNIKLVIGPAAAIFLTQLLSEIIKYEQIYKISQRLYIHPRAAVVLDKHIEQEKVANLARVASTLTGGAAAITEKLLRSTDVRLARDFEALKPYTQRPTEEIILDALQNGKKVLVEGAQGFELDINYGFEYPYCTSRQTHTTQVIADCGIPYNEVDRVYAVIRTYPIRVGNREEGTSGQWPSTELTWSKVEERGGWSRNELKINEKTTTTKRNRRVFDFDYERLKKMVQINQPTDICLNHVDYLDKSDHGVRDFNLLSAKAQTMIKKIEKEIDVKVSLIGTGPNNQDIIDLR
ncbi:Adenylosuccinate synthetase (fragment) [uncultured Sporomusa sp.]|uniref:Adenylosuccinate synthetase n=1 Tax=uncultured Sporomusa sp. TaxID=307249 RepID=A0A212LXR7_9FIRM